MRTTTECVNYACVFVYTSRWDLYYNEGYSLDDAFYERLRKHQSDFSALLRSVVRSCDELPKLPYGSRACVYYSLGGALSCLHG